MKFIAVWGDGIFGVPRSDYDQVEIRIPTSKTAGLCSFSWLLQGDAQVGSRFFVGLSLELSRAFGNYHHIYGLATNFYLGTTCL